MNIEKHERHVIGPAAFTKAKPTERIKTMNYEP